MEKIYTNDDADLSFLKDGKIAVIGYGSQGRAHALNLRDSGLEVSVGARPEGSACGRALTDGFTVLSPAEAASKASVVALLVPDMAHREVYEQAIAPNIATGAALLVAHGFSVHYSEIQPRPDLDVVLVAPKAPGDLVRRQFEMGRGVPCLFAVHQDKSGRARERAMAYAKGLGGTAAGAIQTTFAEETETDLFGEQAVLCGGVTELVTAGFETLVEAGYKPEVAYFECLHELKLIVDLIYEGGFAKMHEFVSETAKFGDLVSGPRVINSETRTRMGEILAEIQTGQFAKSWLAESQAGKPRYNKLLAADLAHPIETVGARLRGQMAWLKDRPKPASKAA